MNNYSLFITCPNGLEETLKQEIESLSLPVTNLTVGGVKLETNLEGLYLCALHLRTTNRILLHLYSDRIKEGSDVALQAEQFKWEGYFNIDHTIAIDFRGNDDTIRNTMYGAQCIKDGISDHFRGINGQRPTIDKENPDIKIRAQLRRGHINVYLDVFAKSLHKRGYRIEQGIAPLKENLASGLLLQSGWQDIAKNNGALIDPLCGSGTFLIEGWQIATKYLPGFSLGEDLRLAWLGSDRTLWQRLYQEAMNEHHKAATAYDAPIIGFDADQNMVYKAQKNIRAAGLEKRIQVSTRDINHFSKPTHLKAGLVISNPPFGERLSEVNALLSLYQTIGKQINLHCTNWRLAILTSDQKLSKAIGLKSFRQYKVKNATLDCLLALFDINEGNLFNHEAARTLSKEGTELLNRLKKNQIKLTPWLKKNNITSYRLYDSDLPEFNVAIDVYQSIEGTQHLHVQEYKAPKTIAETKVAKRIKVVMDVLTLGLKYSLDNISLKQRQRQKGKEQYQRVEQSEQRMVVKDGSVNCFVNLKDFLDTGLFLDHRRLRASFDKMKTKNFLNLFCYTGVASLHAAKCGAVTTNLDLSHTYLNWAKDNFRLNNHTLDKHHFIQGDVLKWLEEDSEKFEVIFCDPPSFSNSKRMETVLDIQKDHIRMIFQCMRKLTEGGILYFSCNLKNFKLDDSIIKKFTVEDISMHTTSNDFKKGLHHAFEITK